MLGMMRQRGIEQAMIEKHIEDERRAVNRKAVSSY